MIVKGRKTAPKKTKFLNLFELQRLLQHLKLGAMPDWDWFILLVAKTGMRYAGVLALTPPPTLTGKNQLAMPNRITPTLVGKVV